MSTEEQKCQGHSKKGIGYGLYCGSSVLAEVFAGFGYGHTGAAYQCDGKVAQRGERSCAGSGAAAIFVEGDIADVMQAVFDGPVGACEGQQALGVGPVRRQACDEISGLDALAPADLPSPLKPRDLCQTRPIEIVGSLAR